MMLGQGMQLGAMPAIPGMQVCVISTSIPLFHDVVTLLFQMGIPGAIGGLVSSQPQLFARPPMLGLPGQQGRV